MNPDLMAENEIACRSLEAQVKRLSDDDLARDLGGGWTVAMALAHLAFWDERAALLLERYTLGTPQHHIPDWYEEMLNQTLEPQWRALPRSVAVQQAVAAALHVTEALRGLDDAVCARLEAHEDGYLLRRFNHRREHIEQIERALS